MKVIGKTRGTAVQVTLPANEKWVTRFVAPASRVVKLSALLDGGGAGLAPQVVRAVIYDSLGNLIATSSEVTIQPGAAKVWLDFPFATPGGVALVAGTYDLGLHAGATASVIRVWGDADVSNPTRHNVDTYADGSSNPFGASSQSGIALAVYATYVSDWSPRVQEEPLYARLPFGEAQAVLAGPIDSQQRYQVRAGWYGTRRSPERGAFVIVNRDGPLAGLVGERLRVSRSDVPSARSVVAYCDASDPIEFDLSLSRRAFLELGELNLDRLDVLVEVVV